MEIKQLSNEKTTANGEAHAEIIKVITMLCLQLNQEFLTDAANKLIQNGARYDSVGFITPTYNVNKGTLFETQGEALQALVNFQKLTLKIKELEEKIKKEENSLKNFNKQFGL